jgi:hypothetical protein
VTTRLKEQLRTLPCATVLCSDGGCVRTPVLRAAAAVVARDCEHPRPAHRGQVFSPRRGAAGATLGVSHVRRGSDADAVVTASGGRRFGWRRFVLEGGEEVVKSVAGGVERSGWELLALSLLELGHDSSGGVEHLAALDRGEDQLRPAIGGSVSTVWSRWPERRQETFSGAGIGSTTVGCRKSLGRRRRRV